MILLSKGLARLSANILDKKMKLTKAQIAVLQAVESGKVYEHESLYMTRKSKIVGCRSDVLKRLWKMGLVTQIRQHDLAYIFILTDLGKDVLAQHKE